ncbi:MAG TPA: NAD(P)H-quinone oxidoreductase [Rhizomicrobium sp.]|nr:NAD(P)H-quinone oxidoreductase [Rhizomicrobium sp.]
MQAIEVLDSGPQYRLFVSEIAEPRPGPGEVSIKVAAAGVNRADLLQARGMYPPPPGAPATLGLEVSGQIAEVGERVRAFRPGDPVCALLTGGGYAEHAVAAQECVLPVPRGVSKTDAAGLPEALFTVWTNLFDTARLKPGESVLIHGGSSGIGTAAIQLCAALGCTVFATAGSAEKCSACASLGATRAINYHSEDYVQVVRESTGGRGVDVILDMVGDDYIERNFEAAAMSGRIVNIAFQAGATAMVNFGLMLQKRLTLAATTLRSRSNAEKGAIRDALLKNVWPLIEAGKIKPVIDSKFPLSEAQAAHARMASSAHIGKIVLVM